MKYLKKYTKINEYASNEELSFEEFKEIMFEITDSFEHEFDYIKGDIDNFYNCVIILPCVKDYGNPPDFLYEFLTTNIANTDYLTDIKDIDDFLNLNIDDLTKEENYVIDNKIKYLKKRIELNDYINNEIFKKFKENILPRFMSYSNFLKCGIGIDYHQTEDSDCGEVRITFDIK